MEDEMIDEFKIEAAEMFETPEDGFLKIEKGEDFLSNYNLIFRAFHSLKGAAGMFGIEKLQSHMHKLESLFEAQKPKGKINKAQIDYFLRGIDVAKLLLEGGSADFEYYSIAEFESVGTENNELKKNEEIIKEKSIEKIEEKKKDLQPIKKHKRGLIYIVDDEEGILDILNEYIQALDFEVKTFNSGLVAIEEIEIVMPDVVITDYSMPEIDGLSMIEKIRELNADLPIIFVSGALTKEVILKALSSGVFGFIEKPFSEEDIKSVCENAFLTSQTAKLLQKSINYILYQFSDLDSYLKDQGKESIRQMMKTELQNIIGQQKQLRELKLKKNI